MILYFSGTGNSAYAARRIGRAVSDETLDLFERLRGRDFSPLHADRPWVVVTPTYAWRIPRLVQDWLERTELTGNKDIYFVMTCGGSIGDAGRYLKKLCAAKGLNFLGCRAVTMPENYLALFTTPGKEEALSIIGRAEDVIDGAARVIARGQPFAQPALTFQDRVNSGPINEVFYPLLVHAKKFYATDACISCGKCAKVCPLGNIRLERGGPVWGKNCTHCMACICRCPTEAIEYGQHSKGLPRYTCPKSLDGEPTLA